MKMARFDIKKMDINKLKSFKVTNLKDENLVDGCSDRSGECGFEVVLMINNSEDDIGNDGVEDAVMKMVRMVLMMMMILVVLLLKVVIRMVMVRWYDLFLLHDRQTDRRTNGH